MIESSGSFPSQLINWNIVGKLWEYEMDSYYPEETYKVFTCKGQNTIYSGLSRDEAVQLVEQHNKEVYDNEN